MTWILVVELADDAEMDDGIPLVDMLAATKYTNNKIVGACDGDQADRILAITKESGS